MKDRLKDRGAAGTLGSWSLALALASLAVAAAGCTSDNCCTCPGDGQPELSAGRDSSLWWEEGVGYDLGATPDGNAASDAGVSADAPAPDARVGLDTGITLPEATAAPDLGQAADGRPAADARIPDSLSTSDACATPVCTPGKKQCNSAGTAVLTCRKDGCGWVTSQGACVNQLCTPKATRCNGKDIEQCNASGCGWTTIRTCPCGCTSAACVGTRDSYETSGGFSNNNAITRATELATGINVCSAPKGSATANLHNSSDVDWYYLETATGPASCVAKPGFTLPAGYKMEVQIKCFYGRINWKFSSTDGDICQLVQQPRNSSEYSSKPGLIRCTADDDLTFNNVKCIDQTHQQTMAIWPAVTSGTLCTNYTLRWKM
jgi:hypothetical protein